MKEATATGATVEEAREAARAQLGEIPASVDVDYEIIDLPQKKTLGLFGGCPAKVRAFAKLPDPVEPKKAPAEKPAAAPVRTVEKYERSDAPASAAPAHTAPTERRPAPAERRPRRDEPIEPREVKPITDEAMQAVADVGAQYLSKILALMEIPAEVKTGQTDESGIELMLEGENLGAVVGRRGETLDALQYLTVLAANRGHEGYNRITLNTGNYREKREKTLQSLARRMAIQSVKTGRNATLEPMNPFERRIIHTAVQDIRGATSWSVGEEPYRRVVIGTGRDNRGGTRTRDNRGGARGGYRRDDRRDDRRTAPVQSAAPANSDREQKKDFGETPLYGKIEK